MIRQSTNYEDIEEAKEIPINLALLVQDQIRAMQKRIKQKKTKISEVQEKIADNKTKLQESKTLFVRLSRASGLPAETEEEFYENSSGPTIHLYEPNQELLSKLNLDNKFKSMMAEEKRSSADTDRQKSFGDNTSATFVQNHPDLSSKEVLVTDERGVVRNKNEILKSYSSRETGLYADKSINNPTERRISEKTSMKVLRDAQSSTGFLQTGQPIQRKVSQESVRKSLLEEHKIRYLYKDVL